MKPAGAALLQMTALGRPVAGRLALAVLAGAAASAAAIGLTATSAWLISDASLRPPVLELMIAITGVRFFGVSRGAFRYAERLAGHDAAFRVLARLRGRVYERLEKLAPAGLAEFQSGDLLSRLVDDVDGLADLWLRVLLPYLVAGVAAAVTIAGIWYLVPAAGAILAISLVCVGFVIPLITISIAQRSERHISGARGELAAATLELLAGAPELLVAGASEARLAGLSEIDRRLASAEARSATGTGAGVFLSSLASGTAIWFGLVAAIVALRAGSLEGVMVAVVALTPIAIHEAVSPLVSASQHLPGLATMAERIADVLARPDPVAEPTKPELPPEGPFGLSCRSLRARYGARAAATAAGVSATAAATDATAVGDALVMPDFDLAAGDRMLVTGSSGSGKSTFAAVLVRFLDPSAGSVELIGSDRAVDIKRLAADDVRRSVCLCAQDPHVFDTSIRENLRLARPSALDAEIRRALEAAQLATWVDTLPDGLDTLVGEHGATISGGQRQRLSLARALLADAPIVVFDEPTEHLDEATASRLADDLLRATAGRTVVMITHRPELMAAAEWQVRVELAPSGRRPPVEG
jgi:thiol reductant ABC exporter CydC subunit